MTDCGHKATVFSAALALLLPMLAAAQAPADASATRYVKDGLIVQFSAAPVAKPDGALTEDDVAEVRFRITDEATGKPVSRLAPGAWMDMAENLRNREGEEQKSCKDKIALYLKGAVGIRPMVDLNSYFVVVMNRDASVSVIDPTVSMAGKTSTLAQPRLPRPGADWARSGDGRRLFISMPTADKLAVLDVETFKVVESIPAGPMPTRIVMQPDGRYLWVGNDTGDAKTSGVTVIDAESLRPVATLPTGKGHHEIALSADSRWALVTNRDAGNVSVIDVRALKVARTVALGEVPMSVAYSPLAKAFFVADGRRGQVNVLRPESARADKAITLKPGLGPMRLSLDGRWLFVLNTPEDIVHVIDAAANTRLHDVAIQGQPFQIEFTREFAYVRSLGSERVSMIALNSVGSGKKPAVQSFAAGAAPPKAGGSLPLASTMAPTIGEAGMLVVNPADNTTYFYMQGMNAPSSNYQAYGSSARAVTVIDRTLKEIEPGVYASRVRLPAAGRFDVAFSLDSPRLLHCFAADVVESPTLAANRKGFDVQYLFDGRDAVAGTTVAFRFKLLDKKTGQPLAQAKDIRVLSYRAPGEDRSESIAREVGDGVYEVALPLRASGAYYVQVASTSLKSAYNDAPTHSFIARASPAAASAPSPEKR